MKKSFSISKFLRFLLNKYTQTHTKQQQKKKVIKTTQQQQFHHQKKTKRMFPKLKEKT